MKRYYDNKKKRSGAQRFCHCGNKLSRYNFGDVCSVCEAESRAQVMDEIKRKFGEI